MLFIDLDHEGKFVTPTLVQKEDVSLIEDLGGKAVEVKDTMKCSR